MEHEIPILSLAGRSVQRFVSVLCVALLASAIPTIAAEAEGLRLIPFPKEIRMQKGHFPLAEPLILHAEGEGEAVAGLLNDELRRAGLPVARVLSVKSPVPSFRLSTGLAPRITPPVPQTNAPEAYALTVGVDEIVGRANEPAGLWYTAQTLCQLIRANREGKALPCMEIRDWPSLRWRCFQDDMTRGPSSTLDTLKFEAALGSYLKLNLMTFYMEHQFAFEKHPEIGPPNGSLTPMELSALVAFVKPLHLDILGNQQSFGHFGQILRHTNYAALRETADVLTPVHEETYRLLDDLYSEVCPLLPFPWFNVCCDETAGLGTGASRDLAAKIGVGGVYVRHVRRVHDLLRDRHGKRMMMWGDIILQHPGNLADLPKDTIMLTWAYDARSSFNDQILPFARSGYEFFVCPGVNNWSRVLPDFGVAMTNIRNFVRDGVQHGALGMINTDWEDDGEAINAVKWHADAWAAECAWNASTTAPEAFNRRVGAVLFGETGDHFGQAVELLGRTHRLPGMSGMLNGRFWENDFRSMANPTVTQLSASNLLALTRPALKHLEACRAEARSNERVLEAVMFGARRMELIGQRMLDGVAAAQLYAQAGEAAAALPALAQIEQLIRRNRDAQEAAGRQFAALWLAESKPYALDWTLRRYTNAVNDYDSLLRRVSAARSAAAAGQPLPSPEEMGLSIPKPLSRCIRPHDVAAGPLRPEIPWADAAATHRLGIVIQAGGADRFDPPLQVELTLPVNLAAKPVRAFLCNVNGTTREVLAQMDPLQERGKARLVLVLPGPLIKGEEKQVHVYLGLPASPQPLPGAVSTTAPANGMRWLENNRVRLLLGERGAHVFRWELKGARNRDITMPGEQGWAGFSDISASRDSKYEVACVARGPALVEYRCTDAFGQTRNISLYGNASWMEVLLSEPTGNYWDFDDPKNFAADGPTPGGWLFSNGKSGAVGREGDGVPAQVKGPDTFWGIKYNGEKLALGLITPGVAARHLVAPGAGAGGAGIEGSKPAQHFVTFAGLLEASPAETMDRLQTSLNLKRPLEVRAYALQTR